MIDPEWQKVNDQSVQQAILHAAVQRVESPAAGDGSLSHKDNLYNEHFNGKKCDRVL